MRRVRATTALMAAAVAAGSVWTTPASASLPLTPRPPVGLSNNTGTAGSEDAPEKYGPLTVGGRPVPDGKYDFMASLQVKLKDATPKGSHFCGGTLISPLHILTAAHCVTAVTSAAHGEGEIAQQLSAQQLDRFQARQTGENPLTAIRVAVGGTRLNGGVSSERRRVADATTHPDYRKNHNLDVAVVTLERPVKNVEPIELATTGSDVLERPGSTATITGWGNTIAQPWGPGEGLGLFQGPNRMHQVTAPIVADAECEAAYNKGRPGDPYVEGETSICAGRTGADACQGDSGGPLFKRVPGGYRQIGITSRGYGCGATGYPGVWTQVSANAVGEFIQTAVTGA